MIHNKIVLFLKTGIIWSSLFPLYVLFLVLLQFFSSESVPLPPKTYSPLIIVMFSILTIVAYNILKKAPQTINYDEIKRAGNTFLFFEYYSKLVPVFLIMFGLSFSLFCSFYQIEKGISLGFASFGIGLFSFFIIYPYFELYEMQNVNLKMSLDISTMIFMKHIYEKNSIDPFFIKKFLQYFKHSLNHMNFKLEKGIKINDLVVDKEKLSIDNTIFYLTPYLKYGLNVEKELFKDNLNEMNACVKEDNKLKNLEVTKYVVNIYKNEKEFLLKYNYQMKPITPIIKLYYIIKTKLFLIFLISILLFNKISQISISLPDPLTLLQSDPLKLLIEPLTLLIVALIGLFSSVLSSIILHYLQKYNR
ncbi:hypothetical protein [uncultured Methanolobus sp.]|uniref:hypothetical protein n=1 Tax=uncultured Methanolobus sp. TaxID=218300 RepID=UPI0029C65912|nr:hypothetical protein [uncultured Methanolobus sp.]